MSNVEKYLTLHRYFLHASRNRSLFLAELNGGRADGPHARLHLELWYACLVPVLDGWKTEAISDPAVTIIVRDHHKVKLLEKCRNAVFHYSQDYVDQRFDELMNEPGIVEWVHGLHEAIGAFFLQR